MILVESLRVLNNTAAASAFPAYRAPSGQETGDFAQTFVGPSTVCPDLGGDVI